MILDIIASFLVSALAATGVGGGGFLVIYLTLLRGMEQLKAQGINLFFFLAGCIPGIAVHMFKRKMNIPLVLIISVFGIAGTFFGAYLIDIINTSLIRKGFGLMLITAGVLSLFKKTKN
ncbi:MAG: TSUP family transporter [Eubacteriales bacterium]